MKFNDMVAQGVVKAPIVIGRDHLDSGSVASPNRETEAMRDGSDAIADWPLLNALINAVGGATWVSIHHGGGVGIGYSIHAGQVIVADGTPEAARRLERVLTTDPGRGGAPRRRRLSRGYRVCQSAGAEDSDARRHGGWAMNVHHVETISLDGASLTIEQVLAVAYGQPGVPRVVLSAAAITQVARAADAVQRLLAQGTVAYGITTGFGAFKDRIIPPHQVELLQRNILCSHAVGVGEPLTFRPRAPLCSSVPTRWRVGILGFALTHCTCCWRCSTAACIRSFRKRLARRQR